MIKKAFRIPFRYLLLLIFIIYIGLLILPYISHKSPSISFQKNFNNDSFYNNTYGTERLAYIDDNTNALQYRLHMIEEAQEEIILSTFDFHSDNAGKDIMAALIHAADRGVRVQVIVDGISGLCDMTLNPWFQALASIPNISVKIYNPVNLLKPWKLQARLHDKYLIIDYKMYLLGGRNTSNLFLGDYSSSKNIDQELFVYETTDDKNSSLYQLRSYFTQVWELSDSKEYLCRKKTSNIEKHVQDLNKRYRNLQKLYPEVYTTWNWNNLTLQAHKITLLQNPIQAENKEPWMWYSIHQLMSQGKSVTLYTPYIICGKEMYADLQELTSNNIQVEIITNDVASGANPFGCTDYLNQKEKIWATGTKVYEYIGAHSSHTKTVLIDDRMSIIGSYNLDMRSTYQDTELMLAVDCSELNNLLRTKAEEDKTYSKTVTDDGSYTYGKNYVPKEISIPKQLFYMVLRVFTTFFRRFL